MHRFRRDELVLLLGAGASVEAGVPHSKGMIERLENLIASESEWGRFGPLYHYVKSAVLFADGMKGQADTTAYNIERLVETLDELSKRDEHPLFPFVGAWHPKLPEVAGGDFEIVSEFRNAIVKRLRDDWIPLDQVEESDYYGGALRLQREYQHPLRIFSLNYDLCVEEQCRRNGGNVPQRGFEERKWNWRRLAEVDDEIGSEDDLICLYKLHGSIDWFFDRNAGGQLAYRDNVSSIPLDDSALIFGTSYKLQYTDPFLFLAYEFRRWALEARMILVVGYGFADAHINEILRQALDSDEKRVLVAVSPGVSEVGEDLQREEREIEETLRTRESGQVVRVGCGAREYLQTVSIESLAERVREPSEGFSEIQK